MIKAKRFWKDATVDAVAGGFAVLLDGRSVKTPAKTPLVVPTRAMAAAVAAEWAAQEDEIDPLSMPVTRSANAALDKVAAQRDEVADMLAEYGGTDLLCYRATSPAELIERQAEQWDPLLDWAAERFGARLVPVSGVMHVPQDADSLKILRAEVHKLGNFELAAFHDLVGLSGSLIIALASLRENTDIEALWRVSRLDELWQEEQWGEDDEAVQQAEIKHQSFLHAHRFYKLCQ